ncbi:MAG: tRNA (cytidine(56)-2'-O)-methyltransferase [Candidatus Heimdallarchaeota archaeon LC_2]|nr:MAG: tRNA (cytidine(56)-2'-O)-methyltransferase [Candidatus Heimdallarchaeota archaeon LC_2]
MKVSVLRLDHRQYRDKRMTTHVALSARSLGASDFYYSGDFDLSLEETITDIVSRWGGKFKISFNDKPQQIIKSWDGIKIHLTMYGENHQDTIQTLKKYPNENILLIVGGAKVPRYIYSLSDFNTAIGWQPHSEVAALSIFLFQLLGSDKLYEQNSNAKMNIKMGNSKSTRSGKFL